MNDARYWWLVLVPEIDGAVEWHHLDDHARRHLFDVATHVACVLENLAQADKMNIAALGNMVRQLHVHVVARHEGDAAWPGPVWGRVTCWPWMCQHAPRAHKLCTNICWREALFSGVAITPVIIFGQIRFVHFTYKPHCRMRPKKCG